ncbi:glutamate synthase [candidate division WOR-1 bacterium RIFOXYB2_FULL_42_35]|uniref:Glutamate synthase n=1 Tax=candidate division WOR-1 bacterium RIFOXYC2_FULL_41_25 TaxID=1802586 RepID=A0A1F4TLT8_UNCSA|nr:MAG: glutamate synthase [candidate division WOR-1 bacterium RIFOXYA2_FULL_41_14]OGC23022.1 MAG: glutamate synthase [candidate division WOR-1 bacterium RIFOXYB2_FULL_42_35]OGC33480.1 MAG: glutamate synthase [candidate division WOR-1 bacterium RIFOXYC2_FULL_41_25]
MGNPKGFLKIKRQSSEYRPVCERVKDYGQVFSLRSERESREQSSRCMDCGVPFCHWACPLGNYIPEWNDAVHNQQWEKACALLEASNILPEVTGRVCPALCEHACVLGVNDDPVTIRENELAIVEQAFKEGLIKPQPPKQRTGKKVAVVGSGPAGLSCAVNLNRAGHEVTVFERDQKVGGIMRYGIPDFKLEKKVLDRRISVWEREGIIFKTGVDVGSDYPIAKLTKSFDAICLAGGSRVPRDLKIPGRNLKGLHFAMEYLTQSNRKVAGEKFVASPINAKGKKVVVIGGGDTGSDCVGTANRQGAACVIQVELLAKPPEERPKQQPWPTYPFLLKTTSSHEEGVDRKWAVLTKEFEGKNGQVKCLKCVQVKFADKKTIEIPDSEFCLEADLVFLAMGFVRPEHAGLLDQLKVDYDQRGNVKADNYQTSVNNVFAAGDIRRGQSLVVWAIYEGRQTAQAINRYLEGIKQK